MGNPPWILDCMNCRATGSVSVPLFGNPRETQLRPCPVCRGKKILLDKDAYIAHLEGYKNAVVEALIINCIYSVDLELDPQKAVHELICWEVKIALDPQVSSDAAALRDHYLPIIKSMIEAWDSGRDFFKYLNEMRALFQPPVEAPNPFVDAAQNVG